MIQLVLNNSLINTLGQAALNCKYTFINRVGLSLLMVLSFALYGADRLIQRLLGEEIE